VVEDDADLRETSAATLTDLGYHIIQAQNADDAPARFSRRGTGRSTIHRIMIARRHIGPESRAGARELRPGINVLFTTGYPIRAHSVTVRVWRFRHVARNRSGGRSRASYTQLLDREVRVA